MGRTPLALGSWGAIRIYVDHTNAKGKPDRYRSVTNFRDFDGRRRQLEGYGRSRAAAESDLIRRLRERAATRYASGLKSSDRFSVAADLWLSRLTEMVADGRRSPTTIETYQRHLRLHVLPALSEVRLGEVNTPLLESVIGTIKTESSPSVAKSSRSVISGILALAVRHGALPANPVRDVDRLAVRPKHRPRALEAEEREQWFAMLRADPAAVAADLPDLTTFMLATGVRIGEALGILWDQVDLGTSEVAITHQVVRLAGQGLVRKSPKSAAGERVLHLPEWCVDMLRARAGQGVYRDEPVFADPLGHFRDPSNVRRAFRMARTPGTTSERTDLGAALKKLRRARRITQGEAATELGWPANRVALIEQGRVQCAVEDAVALMELYRVNPQQRGEILALIEAAARPSGEDGLSWVTSHTFRKTTATILDEAGQSARQIADQLGHARPSMTQDVYMGRRAKNPAAASLLDLALGSSETKSMGKSMGKSDSTGGEEGLADA